MRAVGPLTPSCLLNMIRKLQYSVCTSVPITLSSVLLSSLCDELMGSHALCEVINMCRILIVQIGEERFWTERTEGLRRKVRKDKENLIDEFGEDGWSLE